MASGGCTAQLGKHGFCDCSGLNPAAFSLNLIRFPFLLQPPSHMSFVQEGPTWASWVLKEGLLPPSFSAVETLVGHNPVTWRKMLMWAYESQGVHMEFSQGDAVWCSWHNIIQTGLWSYQQIMSSLLAGMWGISNVKSMCILFDQESMSYHLKNSTSLYPCKQAVLTVWKTALRGYKLYCK